MFIRRSFIFIYCLVDVGYAIPDNPRATFNHFLNNLLSDATDRGNVRVNGCKNLVVTLAYDEN